MIWQYNHDVDKLHEIIPHDLTVWMTIATNTVMGQMQGIITQYIIKCLRSGQYNSDMMMWMDDDDDNNQKWSMIKSEFFFPYHSIFSNVYYV